MTTREFFIQTVKEELSRFDNVIKAMPEEKADYKPHSKSQTARQICMTLVVESASLPLVMNAGKIDFALDIPKEEISTLLQAGESVARHLGVAAEKASEMTEDEWNSPAELLDGGKSMWKTTIGDMVWGFFFDMIHHRGQLSTYIRPMGGKVPNIYGPSGDA